MPTHKIIRDETDSDATFVECDVTDWEAVSTAIKTAEEFGGLNVMVNNIGIIRTGSVTAFDESDYDAVMDVNVKGTFLIRRQPQSGSANKTAMVSSSTSPA